MALAGWRLPVPGEARAPERGRVRWAGTASKGVAAWFCWMPDPKFCLSQVGGGGGDAEAESKGMKGNRLTFGLCPKYLSRDETEEGEGGEGGIIKSPLERPQLKGIRPRACHAEKTASWEGLADVTVSMQPSSGGD